MIVIFTLLMGVHQLSLADLGKVGGQVVALYAITSTIAVAIGLAVANLIDPGAGLQLTSAEAQTAEAPDIVEVFLNIIPENPIAATAEGSILPTIFFVIVFGVALVLVRETSEDESIRQGAEGILRAAETAVEAMFNIVWGVMEYGVIGVFALMAATLA